LSDPEGVLPLLLQTGYSSVQGQSPTQKGTEQKASIRLMNVKTKKDETIISNGKDFTPLVDAQPQFKDKILSVR
jgi:hypothetical protein